MQQFDYTIFQKNLRHIIDSSGKYQYAIAKEIGIEVPTLSRYLKGVRNPDLRYVVMLADYFHVSVDWLVGRSEDKYAALSDEVQEVADLYSVASQEDRMVVQALLNKYRSRLEYGKAQSE